ncbi:pyridoxal phosphate-dependent transferase, major region, subdomain 2 [Aspergillus terreus]|uniref:Pyridoxal phosphate-dependent transferase, major region, subdomain 2 n=1 Tax=Aspergillus terreus TaxID=33178 RepID=A0A8H3RAX7_ASPTE|nr:pyridoxal phosphate-dependent transferase, major region, subdomain 2 [Aspergillus terreus]
MTPDKFVVDSHILHRSFSEEPAKVISGHGIYFVLENGKQVIDATCVPSVSCLGHSQPEITDAITDHLKKNIAYVYSGSPYTNEATEELARMLLSHRPGGLSEATDAALNLAVQYWHEQGQPQRTHFIARKQSYHGNTIDFMSSNVSLLDPCYAYRMKGDNESEAFAQRPARQFEDEILRVGPDHVAGFIAETEDIRGPDIQTIGKALGAGFVPLSGVLLHQKNFDVLAAGSGGLAHGHTFQIPSFCKTIYRPC